MEHLLFFFFFGGGGSNKMKLYEIQIAFIKVIYAFSNLLEEVTENFKFSRLCERYYFWEFREV